MTDSQFLPHPDDTLVQAETGFKANGQKIQAIGQAEPEPFAPPLDGGPKPKIRHKESEHQRKTENEDYVLTKYQGYGQAQNRGNGEPRAYKNVSVVRLAIAGKQKPAHNIRIGLGREEPPERREGLGKGIAADCGTPERGGLSRSPHTPGHFLEERALSGRPPQQEH